MLSFLFLLALLGLVFGMAWRWTSRALATAPVATDPIAAGREIPAHLSFDEYVAGGLRDIHITLVQAARRLRD